MVPGAVTRVLALDIGSSSIRAQVFDEHGDGADEAVKLEYGGTDPDEIVELVRTAIDGRHEGVDAVGTSCFGHSLVVLDDGGRPVTPVLGWRDTRSATAADWLKRRLDEAEVHARTGAYLHTSFWPAKLAWLAETEPEIFRGASRFVSAADYIHAQLRGGEPTCSSSLASGTGLLDLTKRVWDEELLDVLQVEPERLSRISDEPVDGWFPAWIDGACSNVGAGCTSRERAALSVGTSGALRIVYETEQPQPKPGLFLYLLDDGRVVEGGSLSDGGNLYGWIRDTLKNTEGSLADRDPDSHGLTFLTLLGGERSTGWNPFAKGAIAGLTFDTTPLDIRQAALEGVAFRFAEVADLLRGLEDVIATGGGLLANPEWIQIMADALARPVTASKVAEASLRGAAALALERLGETVTDAPLGAVFHPREERAEAYRSARDRQRELYEATRRWHQESP
ncbi:MAG: carbohydrate kinase [Actinobacteria bacterium]|nr:MAG: carbohydrate kinase [Actinomycetota bacterium]